MSKLLKIAAQRRLDVAEAKSITPASSLELKAAETRASLGPPVNLFTHIRSHWRTNNCMPVAAEFKRASPSKGDIAVDINAATQAVKYAEAGAVVVSVLTEPQWFKGSLEDMLEVRRALAQLDVDPKDRRTLVLRKDFIVDRYQVLEASAYGADTLLLIVAILDKKELRLLIDASRECGMEPLVEVANEEEMKTALEVGAKVIGVNNRDLHTFKVDMNTTLRVVDVARAANVVGKKAGRSAKEMETISGMAGGGEGVEGVEGDDVLIIALSGMKTRADVVKYERYGGVAGILVGEALMRSADPRAMIASLTGQGDVRKAARVKICGMTRAEDALAAAKAGADMIGVIFVKKSKRHATVEQAKAIVQAVRSFREKDGRINLERSMNKGMNTGTNEGMDIQGTEENNEGRSKEEGKRKREGCSWFGEWAGVIADACDGQGRPLVVGVFMDQPVEEVNRIAEETGVDMVQLHGSESLAYEAECALPVVRVVHVDADAKSSSHAVNTNDVSLFFQCTS